MRLVAILLLTILTAQVSAQEKFKKEKTGKLSLKTFTTDTEFKKWFVKGYDAYKPDPAIIKRLSTELAGKKIVVVMGTWCSDSQREIPHLIKVTDLAHFDQKSIVIYGTDRKKKRPGVVGKYHVTLVPTIIVFDERGKELGRINETSAPSIEENLLLILKH